MNPTQPSSPPISNLSRRTLLLTSAQLTAGAAALIRSASPTAAVAEPTPISTEEMEASWTTF
jgi:hypothetical protein